MIKKINSQPITIEKSRGKRISNLFLDTHKTILVIIFREDEQNYEYSLMIANGECCSYSWIEQISGMEAISWGARFIALEEIRLVTQHEDENILFSYGYKLKTDKGDIDIELRNFSERGYGGSLDWYNKINFYGLTLDVFMTSLKESKFTEVSTQDSYPIIGKEYEYTLIFDELNL